MITQLIITIIGTAIVSGVIAGIVGWNMGYNMGYQVGYSDSIYDEQMNMPVEEMRHLKMQDDVDMINHHEWEENNLMQGAHGVYGSEEELSDIYGKLK